MARTTTVTCDDHAATPDKEGIGLVGHLLLMLDELGPHCRGLVEFREELLAYPLLSKETGSVAEAQPLVDMHMCALGLPTAPVRFADWDEARASRDAEDETARVARRNASALASGAAEASSRCGTAWAAGVVVRFTLANFFDDAWGVACDATDHAARLVVADKLIDCPNPLAPLMALWKLGYHVGGVINGEFILGVKSAKAEAPANGAEEPSTWRRLERWLGR